MRSSLKGKPKTKKLLVHDSPESIFHPTTFKRQGEVSASDKTLPLAYDVSFNQASGSKNNTAQPKNGTKVPASGISPPFRAVIKQEDEPP